MSYVTAHEAEIKARELVKTLSDCTERRTTDDLELRRLERNARAVMRKDVVLARTVLGGAAALRFDVDGLREHFRVALDHAADRSWVHANHSMALQHAEELQESVEAIEEALAIVPDSPSYLDAAAHRATEAGLFRKMAEFCRRYNAVTPEEGPHDFTEMAKKLVSAMEAGAFTEAAAAQLSRLAGSIQQAHKVHTFAGAITPDWGEPHSFSVRKMIDATPEQAADLNVELAYEWAADESLSVDPGVNLTLSYLGQRAPGAG